MCACAEHALKELRAANRHIALIAVLVLGLVYVVWIAADWSHPLTTLETFVNQQRIKGGAAVVHPPAASMTAQAPSSSSSSAPDAASAGVGSNAASPPSEPNRPSYAAGGEGRRRART